MTKPKPLRMTHYDPEPDDKCAAEGRAYLLWAGRTLLKTTWAPVALEDLGKQTRRLIGWKHGQVTLAPRVCDETFPGFHPLTFTGKAVFMAAYEQALADLHRYISRGADLPTALDALEAAQAAEKELAPDA